uniref:Uncharacterized protein n=1 Tax=Variovorax paradoxus (strain S110) TaxID=543728 RepID=C5CJP0_VARPS
MNRRNLLAAALGLSLAPLAAIAGPTWTYVGSCRSPLASRVYINGELVHDTALTADEAGAIASRMLSEAWKQNGA